MLNLTLESKIDNSIVAGATKTAQGSYICPDPLECSAPSKMFEWELKEFSYLGSNKYSIDIFLNFDSIGHISTSIFGKDLLRVRL